MEPHTFLLRNAPRILRTKQNHRLHNHHRLRNRRKYIPQKIRSKPLPRTRTPTQHHQRHHHHHRRIRTRTPIITTHNKNILTMITTKISYWARNPQQQKIEINLHGKKITFHAIKTKIKTRSVKRNGKICSNL